MVFFPFKIPIHFPNILGIAVLYPPFWWASAAIYFSVIFRVIKARGTKLNGLNIKKAINNGKKMKGWGINC